MTWKILEGHVLNVLQSLPSNQFHCVVTSPPYWGLRDYGCEGQIGLERTPQEYLDVMVMVFREVKRVLRDDGTLWLNMGDCYATGAGAVGDRPGGGERGDKWAGKTRADRDGTHAGKHTAMAAMGPMTQPNRMPIEGLKPKDLVGMPWRLAFALQADGWYLRSDIIWHKPNPMPESVTDRPTKSHEYIFLLSKSERYFYDSEAIKEEVTGEAHSRGNGINPKATKHGQNSRMQVDRDPRHLGQGRIKQNESWSRATSDELVTSRNKRSVWTVATQAFPEAHFATFPEELIVDCILAGTSEKGCCRECGAPLERILETIAPATKTPGGWHQAEQIEGRKAEEYAGKHSTEDDRSAGKRILKAMKEGRDAGADHEAPFARKITVGWEAGCLCKSDPVSCTVLDPFAGSGTTGVVALRYHRDFLGIELNPEYAKMARRRITNDAPLFNTP